MTFLSSKLFFNRHVGCNYSTPQAGLKLWVKHNGNPSTQVPINGCINVDDFSEKVKQKLNTKRQVALFSSLEKEAVDPGLSIKDLLKIEEFKKNSSKSPLFVKLIPVTQDSIASKTIYIRYIDDDSDEYFAFEVNNNEQLRDIYKKGEGLVHLSDPKKVITTFDRIKDGEKYQVFGYSQDFAGWQKNEADAMEAETLLSIKAVIKKIFKVPPQELEKEFYDQKGQLIQEWDGVLLSSEGGTLYLLEAKHSMTVKKVKKIAERLEMFPETLKKSGRIIKYSTIVGIACGTLFPKYCLEHCRNLKLWGAYPSGNRYMVQTLLENSIPLESDYPNEASLITQDN
jgi:hypothetical protein